MSEQKEVWLTGLMFRLYRHMTLKLSFCVCRHSIIRFLLQLLLAVFNRIGKNIWSLTWRTLKAFWLAHWGVCCSWHSIQMFIQKLLNVGWKDLTKVVDIRDVESELMKRICKQNDSNQRLTNAIKINGTFFAIRNVNKLKLYAGENTTAKTAHHIRSCLMKQSNKECALFSFNSSSDIVSSK